MRIDAYDWAGGHEAMLRFGPAASPVVVVAMPLLEEWNRTRAFVVAILRLLAERGVASALPDLPGMGESLVPMREASLSAWRQAYAAACAAAGGPVVAASIRGGALIEARAPVAARWRLAPSTGAEAARDIGRLASLGGGLVAGHAIHPDLVGEMAGGEAFDPERTRVVRLETDPRPADLTLPGRALWRASEPDMDERLATAAAADIAFWTRACVA